jgi:hypothetical protein
VIVLTSIEQTGVLDAVDAGRDRHAQALDARRVRLDELVAPVALVDDDLLGLWGEADERRLGEVAGAAEFQEVRAAVHVGVDRDAELGGRHAHQLLAAALCDEVVHLLLKQRELAHDAAEGKRVRPAPAQDVARGEDARSRLVAARDHVAPVHERHERAVAVAHGRDAVGEVDLRSFDDDVVEAGLIPHHRLVAIVLAAVEREMDVRVDHAGDDPAAACVDLRRGGGNRHGVPRSNGRDAPPADDDRPVGNWRIARAVDDRRADDRGRRRRLDRVGR